MLIHLPSIAPNFSRIDIKPLAKIINFKAILDKLLYNFKYRFIIVLICLFPLTVTFAQSIELNWSRLYDVPGDSLIRPCEICVDDGGSVYVAGNYFIEQKRQFCLIKYNANGDSIWTRRYCTTSNDTGFYCNDMTLDHEGNVYITGHINLSGNPQPYCAVLKYSPGGNLDWSNYFYRAEGTQIKVDTSGYILVGGHWQGPNNQNPLVLLIKYYPNGDTLWSRVDANGTSVNNIVFDANNNIYIAASCNTAVFHNFATIKYFPDGTFGWARTYRYHNNNEALGIGIGDSENVYAVGYSENSCSNPRVDFYVTRYQPDGMLLWADRYNLDYITTCYYNCYADHVDFDATGNLYVGGTSTYEYLFVKYSPNGVRLWPSDVRYNCGLQSSGLDFVVTNEGTTIAVGGYRPLGSYLKIHAFSFDSSGARLWSVLYDSSGSAEYNFAATKIDDSNNIYITGRVIDSSYVYQIITIKYHLTNSSNINDSQNPEYWNSTLSNYPNPFNAQTTISYSLPQTEPVKLSIYNLLGQKVATLLDAPQTAGEHTLIWNASPFPSGIYFARLEIGNQAQTIKVVLLK
jgi:hypothetical protein